MSTKVILFKTSDGRELDEADAGTEIVRLAHEKQAACPTLSFSAARDLVMRAEPAMAKAWLGMDED